MYHVSVQGVDERVINVLSTLSLFFTKGLKQKGVTVKTVESGSGNQKRVAFPSKFVVATDISLALGLERMVVVFVPEGSLTKLTGKLRKEKEKEKRKRKNRRRKSCQIFHFALLSSFSASPFVVCCDLRIACVRVYAVACCCDLRIVCIRVYAGACYSLYLLCKRNTD